MILEMKERSAKNKPFGSGRDHRLQRHKDRARSALSFFVCFYQRPLHSDFSKSMALRRRSLLRISLIHII